MASNILSGGLVPFEAWRLKLKPKHKAALAADAPKDTDDQESCDPVREAQSVDLLYEEAEAIRLQTPPPTPRCGAEADPLRAGLLAATGLLAAPEAKPCKVPLAVESLLFPGLVMEARPRTRAKSRRRSVTRADKGQKLQRPGCITPTTASQTHLASSVGMDPTALAGA